MDHHYLIPEFITPQKEISDPLAATPHSSFPPAHGNH